jgi:serine/threonine protein kinase
MELVAGVDFLHYVRPDAVLVSDARATQTSDTVTPPSGTQAEALGGGRSGTLELTRLWSTLRQIAAGLMSLHARGHIHCDLKPQNVIVTPEGRAVIIDFGSCSSVGLRPGQLRGTLGFMSPEQLVGELSEAADWYAFGAMMQCALTGRLPYGMSSVTKYSAQYCGTRLDARVFDRDLPSDLVELALCLMDPIARNRPSGSEVASALALNARCSPVGRSCQI